MPFYENFVCSLVYSEQTANVTPYPETAVYSVQSCGVMPINKWNSGTFDTVGLYTSPTCDGSDWSIDYEKTKIVESGDG